MTKEVLEIAAESPDTNTEPQFSEIERKALEQGWRPKEEWEGDPEKWRDAKEFTERGELFGKMENMSKELKETRKALKMLQEHHTKLKEADYKKSVDELKTAQKRYLEEGKADEYLKATEALTEIKAEQKAREVLESEKPKLDPRFAEWVNENSWYEKDSEMKRYADSIGMGYAQANPGMDPEDVLKYVSEEVKIRFRDKFENPNRRKPNAVEGGGGAARASGKTNQIELTDDERRVMNTFVRQGIMSKEEYIEEVRRMRGTN